MNLIRKIIPLNFRKWFLNRSNGKKNLHFFQLFLLDNVAASAPATSILVNSAFATRTLANSTLSASALPLPSGNAPPPNMCCLSTWMSGPLETMGR
jgi:hypothetical protein